MRRSVCSIAILLAAGCAARSQKPAPGPSVADADRLGAAGCYRCLLDAQAIYERELAARPTPPRLRAAFRTAILLALREKEAGLAATPHLERARTLAAQLPPEEDAGLALRIADAINWDYAGLSKEASEEFLKIRQAAGDEVRGWRARLQPRLAIALVPAHREALLGRTIALTYLERRDEAIATATQIIDLGSWYVGDAYYWRAFNRRAQQQLDAARDDIEISKERSGVRSEVFLLAGMIYYDRRELDGAVPDLERAWTLSDTSCDAAWYLGLIRAERKAWEPASDIFEKAADCYRGNAEAYRVELAQQQQLLGDSEEGREVSGEYERAIARQLTGEARSAFNVAYASAQLGDRSRAMTFAGRAAAHEVMNARATELIEALKKLKP